MLACSKENISVSQYFITSTWAQNAKLAVNFLVLPLVKFCKIWQTVNKIIFYFSWRSFSREICKTSFLAAVKHINLKELKILPLPLHTHFYVFKICILLNATCCENFERWKKFKKITNKAIKQQKTYWFGRLQLKTKTQNNSRILFNHCLLHLLSVRGLGEKRHS